jgi:hypothetical protein
MARQKTIVSLCLLVVLRALAPTLTRLGFKVDLALDVDRRRTREFASGAQ